MHLKAALVPMAIVLMVATTPGAVADHGTVPCDPDHVPSGTFPWGHLGPDP